MKFYVEVYGCTANKSDANLIKGLISNHPQHQLITSPNQADVLIILTCTVIDTTEQRMLHRIKELMNTERKVVIAGCMASVQQELIREKFPTALLLSPRKIHYLFEILSNKKREESIKQKAFAPKQYTGLIAPIAIAEGCLFSCSYCITHLARGKLHSYPEKAIISSVKDAINQGCKEIQITAQDTASYGINQQSSLPLLLKKIVNSTEDGLIRVGMMNPRTTKMILPDLLLQYNHHQIYSFLHLPIQSGDNHILEKMNRGYKIQDAEQIITKFRTKYPDITIATDAIVGFPTETNEQFQQTKELLQRIKPDVVNITRFSARPFTKAKKMNGRIPTEIVKERSRELTSFCKKLTTQRNNRYIGKTINVLTLKKGTQNTIIARSMNYKPVTIKKQIPLGEKRTVDIIDATETHLVGMLK
ncbi:MAG TPA: tRNA (N(6)-L-threonylcarbamoyladenosine(37)-C(2))-methylthiotransferase [Candidatus Thermoplasmatota archaeon]|nr:tRNA (N(6)-L-threonylcarbamoyladenosine(37)-C(2))-methylthiotransferase [Candidatus Thermoplasmatota archaeon]